MMKFSLIGMVCCGLCLFGYAQYQDKQHIKRELKATIHQLNQLNLHIEKTRQIVAERETQKAEAILRSEQLQEKLTNALSNNKCAHEPVPRDIVAWLQRNKH